VVTLAAEYRVYKGLLDYRYLSTTKGEVETRNKDYYLYLDTLPYNQHAVEDLYLWFQHKMAEYVRQVVNGGKTCTPPRPKQKPKRLPENYVIV